MNEVANRGAAASAVAALGNLRQGLENVQSTIVVAGGVPILRMLKDGMWVYGAENVEIEAGSRWAVNPYSLTHGWVAWTDRPKGKPNEIVGESMVPMTSPIPPASDLPDVSDKDNAEWKQQLSIELQCLNGTDIGETVVYKTTSTGGMNAIKTLIAALMKQLDTSPDRPVPVLNLTFDTYMHKVHGKVYVPVLEVVKWVELSDTAPEIDEPEQDEPEAKAEPAKQTRQRRAAPAETKPEPEQTKAAPQTTAADRKAALLAELQALAAEDGETAEAEDEPEQEAPAEPQVRRRRPARA